MSEQETVEFIKNRVMQTYPDATFEVAPALYAGGTWHLDCHRHGRVMVVSIESSRVGISVMPREYGFDADRYFDTAEEAIPYLVKFLADVVMNIGQHRSSLV